MCVADGGNRAALLSRFGSVDVSCEGYEYPDDQYILAGSCGLRYSLDYTKEGAQHQHDYGYGGGGGESSSYGWSDDVTGGSPYKTKSKSMGFFTGVADLIMYCAMGLMAWAFYKTCISPSRGTVGDRSDSTTNDDYPAGGGGGGYGWNLGGGGGGGTGGHGPNQGHRHDGDDASCHNRGARPAGGGGGGFWTGAATGGLLGYMFGNRGGGYNRAWGGGGYNRGIGGGGGWGGGGWGGGGTGFRSSSSGTRSASGFGGTSRR